MVAACNLFGSSAYVPPPALLVSGDSLSVQLFHSQRVVCVIIFANASHANISLPFSAGNESQNCVKDASKSNGII